MREVDFQKKRGSHNIQTDRKADRHIGKARNNTPDQAGGYGAIWQTDRKIRLHRQTKHLIDQILADKHLYIVI